MKRTSLQPVITETSLKDAKNNWYTFRVPTRETKNSLSELIAKTFGVDVLAIKTSVVKGKNKRSLRSRKISRGSNWKKVIVKLKEDQKISVFDQA